MKKISIVFLFLFVTTFVYSQRFVGSIILGTNITQVDGDEVAGYKKFGINGGASVMLALHKNQCWFATLELLYTQKGSHSRQYFDLKAYAPSMFQDVNPDYPFDPNIKCKLNLDYVEIPLVFHYEDPKTGVAFGLGAAWGRLVYAREIYNGYRRTTDIRSETYRTNDWSAIADVKIRLYKGLKLNFRFQYSFVPIRKMTYTTLKTNGNVESWERNQYNNVLTLRLIYSFNEKYTPNTKINKKGERQGTKWVRDTFEPYE